MNADTYKLIFSHSCGKGQAWLAKNRHRTVRDLVQHFFDDDITFLRFVSLRLLGQRILSDNPTDESIIKVATDLADPQVVVYTAKAVIAILDKAEFKET